MIYEPICLDPHRDIPMYRQLYDSVRHAIGSGGLRVGDRLPSIRKLSEELGVSRTTVEQAYQQLCVEGYIASRPQSGYYVEAVVTDAPPEPFLPSADSPAVRERPIRYDFGSRYVETRRGDMELWRKYVRAVLSREDIVSSYGHFQGEPALRTQLAAYGLRLRGVNATPDRIVVGAGVQPLLSLLCGLLGEDAGRVGIESPCFPQAERVFRDFRLDILPLGHDRYGVTAGELYDAGIHVLYLNPANTESMGRPMPIRRRAALLQWAETTGGLIVEDDYNGALRFQSRPVPAMQSMPGGERVIYLGSFSKLLMPSVRLSYMVLPPDLASRYAERGASYNQTSSKIEQLALADYLRDGHIEKRLRRLRKTYADKSARLTELLSGALGHTADISLAETALCVDVRVACGMTSRELAEAALAEGVRVMPMPDEDRRAHVRLSFAGIAAEDMPGGVEMLRRIITNDDKDQQGGL